MSQIQYDKQLQLIIKTHGITRLYHAINQESSTALRNINGLWRRRGWCEVLVDAAVKIVPVDADDASHRPVPLHQHERRQRLHPQQPPQRVEPVDADRAHLGLLALQPRRHLLHRRPHQLPRLRPRRHEYQVQKYINDWKSTQIAKNLPLSKFFSTLAAAAASVAHPAKPRLCPSKLVSSLGSRPYGIQVYHHLSSLAPQDESLG